MATSSESNLSLFRVQGVLSRTLYIQPSFLSFTRLLHCSLSMHISIASLGSSDTAIHAFLTQLGHCYPPSLPAQTCTLSHSTALHLYAPHVWTSPKPSSPLNHSSLLAHQLCASLLHSPFCPFWIWYSAHKPKTLHFHNIYLSRDCSWV